MILSPHLDDAVLSCGQLLADRPECVVVTVFAGTPPRAATTVTTYDRACGFLHAQHAMNVRRIEDEEAVDSFGLGHRVVHLGHLDHQYEPGVDFDLLATDLDRVVRDLGTVTQLVAPLGLAHPDHHAVAEAARRFHHFTRPDLELWLYEDLPSRVLYPDEVFERMGWWAVMGYDLTGPVDAPFGRGPLEVKARAVECYRSQLGALGEHGRHAVLAPERLWRAWRAS